VDGSRDRRTEKPQFDCGWSVHVPEPLVLLRQFIADLAVAFLLVVSSFHLPAARVPGRDRLKQAGRLVAVVAAVAAVAAVVAVAVAAAVAIAVAVAVAVDSIDVWA